MTVPAGEKPDLPTRGRMAKLFALDGRVALVTGASRGIGRAIAEGLADAGATVVGVGRTPASDLPETAFLYRSLDVTDADAVAALCKEMAGRFGRFDILVNAAAISLKPAPDATGRLAAFDATLNANLRAPYACCLAAAEQMDQGGSIINVTSINSVLGFPGNPGYVAAKGGLRQLTRALAVDLGPRGIRVNNLAPGYVRTAMTEASYSDPALHAQRLRHMILPRWGEPADLQGAAVFLASEASAYVTGQDLFVDGGWTAKGLT
ncbi:SDR family oxidoreductase [Azospirillum thermophilum]|nr:SDR family oxidoreductase [Azospirillum thermophilum]